MSKVARAGIALFAVFLAIYFAIYFSYPLLSQIANNILPSKEKPVLLYGKIPAPKITGLNLASQSKPKYVLNTKNGALPSGITPDLANIFEFTPQRPTFGTGQAAQNKAAILKFFGEDNTSGFGTSTYTWLDKNLSRELQINISANTLDYKVNIPNIEKSSFTTNSSYNTLATEDAKEILTSLGYLNDSFYNRNSNQPSIVMGKFQNGRLIETTTPLDYTVAKVDFTRTLYKIPLVGSRYDDSPLSVTVANSSDSKLKYLKITAHVWELESKTFGKYTPLPLSEAWKKISAHEGFITKAKLKTASAFEEYQPVAISEIFIDEVTFAYYDSLEPQKYLQPIYIFKGTFLTPENQRGDIAIYYPAVHPKHFQ